MKKTFVAAASAAAIFAMSGSALAGDLYAKSGYKDAPIVVAEPTWTGFYIGLGVGGQAVNHDLSLSDYDLGVREPVGNIDGVSGTGVVGTVEVGYDRQFGNVVAGVFFNYDFGDDVSSSLRIEDLNVKAKQTDSWTAGGRLGYLVNTSTLAYVLGGYTDATFELSVPGFGSADDNFTGWTVGGGLETRLSGNWYVKGEYRFTEFDTNKYALLDDDGDGFGANVDTSVQTVRLVLSYKANLFGSDLSVPLK
ncbi:porin family protein [Rhodomicrobium vannielii ATCC 17100]|uniref:outer membrane protein n=1 Tax=Rhodomicrobium vannielii TaxID=1069 RepID=UPI001917F333|nr:outer membrane beta-barrel protein [Rhodomicrobium vannielii]MBJ7535123.1 porin family protein [Rhodomicrobium vannielii ATCC 17100]